MIVNLLGDTRLVNTFTGGGGGPIDALRTRLVWNAPTTTSLTFTGFPQFQGSILAGNPGGTTNIDTPGVNGRIALAGDLVHSGDGAELHNYPFDGQLPGCAPTQPPTTETPTTVPATTEPPGPGSMTAGPSELATLSNQARCHRSGRLHPGCRCVARPVRGAGDGGRARPRRGHPGRGRPASTRRRPATGSNMSAMRLSLLLPGPR